MNTALRFAGTLEPTLAIGLAVVAAIIVFVIYRIETAGMPRRVRWLLPTLRSLAVLMVITLLAGPVLEISNRVGNFGTVLFVVDRSESMQHHDSSQEVSRLRRVNNLLQGEEGLIKQLQLSHDVKVLQSPKGNSATDLAGLLATALNDSSIQSASKQSDTDNLTNSKRTIVLVSDGQNNSGESPINLAEQLANSGIALATWGFGESTEPKDLAILNIQHPDRLNATGRMRGTIQYKVSGVQADAEAIELLIRDSKGSELWSQRVGVEDTVDGLISFEIPIEQLVENTTLPISAIRRELLRLELSAEIREVELGGDTPGQVTNEETDKENNSRKFSFLAVRSDYKILIIDGRSRWEVRYLKNLFGRDPQWQATTVIFANQAAPGRSTPSPSESSLDSTLPSSFDQMIEYDLVCVGEVPEGKLDGKFLQWLSDYVARGGGLVLLDGQRDHLRRLFEKEQRQLVPVDWLGDPKPFFADRIEPTSVGLATSWLSLGDSLQQNNRAWSELPAPRAMRLVSVAKDAETLLEADLGAESYPLLATKSFGGGRVVYFASDETWRWRYKLADSVHSRFWNQLALALTQPAFAIANEYAELDVEKAEYRAGDRASIRVRLKKQDGSFANDANVEAFLYKNGEQVQSFALAVDARLPGMYVGQSAPLPSGDYSVRFTAAEFGQVAEELTADFSVLEPLNREQLQLRQNITLMRDVANAGDGRYFAEGDFQQLEQYLMQRTSGKTEFSRISLWDGYYWFVPVICLLGFEWWLRKRWGLP